MKTTRPRERLNWKLRPYRSDDAADLRRAIYDRAIARNTATIPHPYTLGHARAWIRRCRAQRGWRGTKVNLAITVDGRVCGAIGVDRDGDQAEIGYWLARSFWGRGLMTSVVRTFVLTVFRHWPVERVIAKTFPTNTASRRVLEKNGFRHVADEVHAVRKGNRWYTAHLYTKHRR